MARLSSPDRWILFAQNGEGSPLELASISKPVAPLADPLHHFSYNSEDAARAADRYFVAECESGAEGLGLISRSSAGPEAASDGQVTAGRIVATGGKGETP
jgi:hypothetical protein